VLDTLTPAERVAFVLHDMFDLPFEEIAQIVGRTPAAARQLARAAVPALIDGAVGLVWAPGGRPRVAFAFTLREDKVVAIDLVADPERLGRLNLVILEDRPRGHPAGSGSER
jgi:hypothetical protein